MRSLIVLVFVLSSCSQTNDVVSKKSSDADTPQAASEVTASAEPVAKSVEGLVVGRSFEGLRSHSSRATSRARSTMRYVTLRRAADDRCGQSRVGVDRAHR